MIEDYMTKGATVAISEDRGDTIVYDTIERLTPTLVVLAGGRRFRRGNMFKELKSDNGHGFQTNLGGRLVDPTDKHVVDAFARQQLRELASRASRSTYGSGATIHTMDAAAVREELLAIQDVLMAARKEIDRRAGL